MLPLLAVLASACTQNDRSIVVLFENDVHCNASGYPVFAGMRDAINAADTSYVACVSCGDYIQGGFIGSISKGEYIADIMKTVGYDAIGLGNHELDFLFPQLEKIAGMIGAPVVCANFTKGDTDETVFAPYVIKKMGRKKVAFVGALTPSTQQLSITPFNNEDGSPIFDLHEKDTPRLIQKAVDAARAEGADYVVLLSHLGEVADVSSGVTSHNTVEATRGIDVVLDGHTHARIPLDFATNLDGQQIPITQTGYSFANIGKLVISRDGAISIDLIPTESVSYSSPVTQAAFDSISALVSAKENEIIGHTDYDLLVHVTGDDNNVRFQETNMGDFVADAYRIVSGSDVAIANGGAIREGLFTGDITFRNIRDAHPYDNNLSTAEVTGQDILDALEVGATLAPDFEFGAFMQVSGLKYSINTSIAPTLGRYEFSDDNRLIIAGPRRICNVQIMRTAKNGKITWEPIKTDAKYTLTTTSYNLYGGRELRVLMNAPIVNDEFILYSDALIEYIQKYLGGTIPATYRQPQGRITFIRK